MTAVAEPLSPVPDANGYTEPFNYTWEGTGSISFPVGTTYEVVNTNDAGEGSLRAAITEANENDGLDTVVFDSGVRGRIPLESELQIADDLILRANPRRISH